MMLEAALLAEKFDAVAAKCLALTDSIPDLAAVNDDVIERLLDGVKKLTANRFRRWIAEKRAEFPPPKRRGTIDLTAYKGAPKEAVQHCAPEVRAKEGDREQPWLDAELITPRRRTSERSPSHEPPLRKELSRPRSARRDASRDCLVEDLYDWLVSIRVSSTGQLWRFFGEYPHYRGRSVSSAILASDQGLLEWIERKDGSFRVAIAKNNNNNNNKASARAEGIGGDVRPAHFENPRAVRSRGRPTKRRRPPPCIV